MSTMWLVGCAWSINVQVYELVITGSSCYFEFRVFLTVLPGAVVVALALSFSPSAPYSLGLAADQTPACG